MIEPYLSIVAEKIQALSWIDKAGGVVQLLKRKEKNGAVKSLPVAVVWEGNECSGTLEDMVPNDKHAAMTYFEVGSPTSKNIGSAEFRTYPTALICWFDSRKLAPNDIGSLSSVLINTISGNHETQSAAIPKIFVAVKNVRIDKAIFDKYSYDETTTQYLMHPYGHFVIDLFVSAAIATKCPNIIVNKVSIEC